MEHHLPHHEQSLRGGRPLSDPVDAGDAGDWTPAAIADLASDRPTGDDTTVQVPAHATTAAIVATAVAPTAPSATLWEVATALAAVVPPMAFPFGLNAQRSRSTSSQRAASMRARHGAEESASSKK